MDLMLFISDPITARDLPGLQSVTPWRPPTQRLHTSSSFNRNLDAPMRCIVIVFMSAVLNILPVV